MNEKFAKSLYESIVKENLDLYKEDFEDTEIDSYTEEYWIKALEFYSSLTDTHKDILMKIIEQTMVDTISNVLGIIDGHVTQADDSIEPKLYLNSKDTDGELQDSFLEYVEDLEKNS